MAFARARFVVTALIASAIAATAARADDIDDQVQAVFATDSGTICFADAPTPPDIYNLTYREPYDGATDQDVRIYRFFCGMGAYNSIHMYYLYSELNGIQQMAFAEPTYDVRCANGVEPAASDCQPSGLVLTGVTTTTQLVNSDFDPATQSIASHGCWRGVCDAFDEGHWVFDQGQFVLETFAVDPSFDGAINPVTVVDYTTDQPLIATPASPVPVPQGKPVR